MTAEARISVRGEDVEAFRRDGAVMLRSVLDDDWVPEFAELGLGPGDYPGCAMCPAITVKSQQAEHL